MNIDQQRWLVRYPNALEGDALSKPLTKKKAEDTALTALLDNFIKAEANLERLPFFAPWDKARGKKLKHTLQRQTQRDDINIEISWTVFANPSFGFPNAFDLDVYRAIQQLIHDRYPDKAPEDGVVTFTFRDIERRMRQSHSGQLMRYIIASLKRLVATTVDSKGTFYLKGESRFINETFHIFDGVTFTGEPLPGGGIADINHLFLSKWYLGSLKAWYVMPLDTHYHFRLRSTNAKALYGRLCFYFYARPEGQEWVRRKYSELCEETIITRQPYLSHGQRYLQPALKELIDTQLLSKVDFEPIGKTDAWIYFWPGPRITEPERFRRVRGQTLLPGFEEPLSQAEPKAKQDQTIALIQRFYDRLYGVEESRRRVSDKEKQQTEHLITTCGPNWFEQFIDYALEQKKTRWPDMATLSGAIDAFADEFTKRHQEHLERQSKDQQAKKEDQIIQALRPHYRHYFETRLTEIRQHFPEAYNRFQRALHNNPTYQQTKQAVQQGGDHWLTSLHTIEYNIAQQVFDDLKDPSCRVLDFVDWRQEHQDRILKETREP